MWPTIRSERERALEEAPDPHRGEGWFEELPEDVRQGMTHEWRSGLARDAELRARDRNRAILEVAQVAAVFGLFDLLCPAGGPGTFLSAIALGGLVGAAVVLVDASRLGCVLLGLPAFFLHQWLTLGGLTGIHLLLFFLFGCVLAVYGWRREERAFE